MNQIFDLTDERYTIRHLTGQVRSVFVQRTFCPLHIRYIFVLSVIHPLLIRQSPLDSCLLSVTCPLHMRYSCVLCAPYMFCEDPHRHRDDFLFIVTPIVGVCNCSMFCCTLLYVHFSIAIILMGKRELIALLYLSSWCLVWLSGSSSRCHGVVCSL